MDIDVVATEDSHRIRNEPSEIFSSKTSVTGEGYSISFDGSTADLVIGENLIVHDLIPTRNDRWMPDEFKSWSTGKVYIGKPRYWLSVIDAATLLPIWLTLDHIQGCTCVVAGNGYVKTRKQN